MRSKLPVEHGVPPHLVSLSVDGLKMREFEIELAGSEPDHWVFTDVGDWFGREPLLEVEGVAVEATVLERDALHPDASGACWSGSAVVDWDDTSGLGSGEHPPLVLAYTIAGGQDPWSKGKPFVWSSP